MKDYESHCDASVYGRHNIADRNGICNWCGKRIAYKVPKPQTFEPSDLTEQYDYFYDNDWGSK